MILAFFVIILRAIFETLKHNGEALIVNVAVHWLESHDAVCMHISCKWRKQPEKVMTVSKFCLQFTCQMSSLDLPAFKFNISGSAVCFLCTWNENPYRSNTGPLFTVGSGLLSSWLLREMFKWIRFAFKSQVGKHKMLFIILVSGCLWGLQEMLLTFVVEAMYQVKFKSQEEK